MSFSDTQDKMDAALDTAIADYEADSGGSADEVFYDLFVSVVLDYVDHPEAAREFCRVHMGYVPQCLVPHLGKADWLS